MELSPENVSKEEGLRLLKAGEFGEAIKIFEKVKAKSPDDAQLLSYLGVAYNEKGDKLNAIASLEASLLLKETTKARYNLGLIYESVHRYDEAIREYQSAQNLDPNYAPAQQALNKLRDQFAASHPQQVQPTPAAAAVTQAVPAADGPQPTQVFGGLPEPAIGQAPMPITDPFAQTHTPPPTQEEYYAKQLAKEQAVVEQHHMLMKSGLIYGMICGAIFIVLLSFASQLFQMGLGIPGWATRGAGFLFYIMIIALVGAGYGALVGLWIGYTCGGEGAGFQAGAVIGAFMGLLLGLLMQNGIASVIISMLLMGISSGCVGLLIGRMVDASINT